MAAVVTVMATVCFTCAAPVTSEDGSQCNNCLGIEPICFDNCEETDGRSGKVKCIWCRHVYHKKCTGYDHAYICAYICDACRKLPTSVDNILNTVAGLSELVTSLINTNGDMHQMLSSQSQKIAQMQSSIASLSNTSPPKLKDLVLGSSVIRNLDNSKLIDTDVMSISGGRIKDIHQKLKDSDTSYGRITLVVGGNDCSARQDPETIDNLASQYVSLIDEAKLRAPEVCVSTVLPRVSDIPDTDERIDSLNAALITMEGNRVSVVNNDSHFKLGQNTINDGYYTDLTHPNAAGTTRLAQNLGLRIHPDHHKDVSRHSYASVAQPRRHRGSRRAPAASSASHGGPGRPDRRPAASPHAVDRRPTSNSAHSRTDTTRGSSRGVSRQHQPQRDASRPSQSSRSSEHRAGNHTPRSPPGDHGRDNLACHQDGDGRWTIVDHHRRSAVRNTREMDSSNSGDGCSNCNERNHQSRNCRHGKPLQCDVCRQYGHKAKHHGH